MEIYHYFAGSLPLILSIPHAGTYLPAGIKNRFTAHSLQIPDTDWHVDKLYEFAKTLGVHILIANYSRYVVDLNRSRDDIPLYPGKFNSSLCPTTMFDGLPIYKRDFEPDANEIAGRINRFWQPYHDKLQFLILELKQNHPRVVLLDAHSIASRLPLLFEGELPNLNIGTADGASASKEITQELFTIAQKSPYSVVCNERFKGGYITRHYGQPNDGIQAIQLEISQKNYMQEKPPYSYDQEKARQLVQTLEKLIKALLSYLK